MKRRILLAEDDESVRKMLGRVLDSENYETVLAGTRREAMIQALRDSPDLVLLDIGKRKQENWEVFELIYRLQPSVPVIAITARPSQYPQRLPHPGRFIALIEKPFDLAMLLNVIRELLEKSNLDRVQKEREPGAAVRP